jgi:hypothetical protein
MESNVRGAFSYPEFSLLILGMILSGGWGFLSGTAWAGQTVDSPSTVQSGGQLRWVPAFPQPEFAESQPRLVTYRTKAAKRPAASSYRAPADPVKKNRYLVRQAQAEEVALPSPEPLDGPRGNSSVLAPMPRSGLFSSTKTPQGLRWVSPQPASLPVNEPLNEPPAEPAPEPAPKGILAIEKTSPSAALNSLSPPAGLPLLEEPVTRPQFEPDICQLAKTLIKPINKLNTDIRLKAKPGSDIPKECPWGDDEQFRPREFEPITFCWTASALCHHPLYFEEVQLERYGHSLRPWMQPFVSGAHFFLTVPVLPYEMGLTPPCECLYTLGYYRPGSCAPWILDPIPLSVRAGVFEAGAWVGAAALIP